MIPDAVDKFVDQADPLVEVSVLHGITVVRGSVVIDIRPEAVALNHTFFSGDGEVHFHAFREDLPAGRRNLQALLKTRPRGVKEKCRTVGHLSRDEHHVFDLKFRAEIRRDLRIDVIEVRAGQPADHIENMRMIAERAAAETMILRRKRNNFAVARLGIALPWERPHRRKRDIRRLNRNKFAELAGADNFLQPFDHGVVVHFEFDLADDPGPVNHFDHFVIFGHVEGRDLHREDVEPALRAELHLFKMAVIGGRDYDRFDVRMFRKHFFGIKITGNSGFVEFINLPGLLVFRTGSNPVEFRVFDQCLVIFTGVAMGHAHHCDFHGFHCFTSEFFNRRGSFSGAERSFALAERENRGRVPLIGQQGITEYSKRRAYNPDRVIGQAVKFGIDIGESRSAVVAPDVDRLLRDLRIDQPVGGDSAARDDFVTIHRNCAGRKSGTEFDAAAHAVGETEDDVAGFFGTDRIQAADRTVREPCGKIKFACQQFASVAAAGESRKTESRNIFERFTVNDFFEFDKTAFDAPWQKIDAFAVGQFQLEVLRPPDDDACGNVIFAAQEIQRFIHFFKHDYRLLIKGLYFLR